MTPKAGRKRADRFNVEVMPGDRERVARIRKLGGGRTISEQQRRATALYEEVLRARAEGVDLVARDGRGGERSLWLVLG